jgi:thiosulfate/3-mercaptopyruvate sulfurtransferase
MTRRTIDPIVSTDWLAAQRGDSRPVVIDVREPHVYTAGHIPGAISIPFSPVSDWATSSDELMMELPEAADLFAVIGDSGITAGARVVVVTTVDKPPAPPYSLSDATRVAATLIYAGVENVAILDGGHPKWQHEGREISGEIPEAAPVRYHGVVRSDSFASTDYVKRRMGSAVLLDGRDPHEYFGMGICPFARKAGHIPTARSLPARWLWEEDGTYRPVDVLRQMAAGVAGEDKGREIITYCGVGGYASSLWFVLAQVLGYGTVRIYDGAAEAWAKENEMVRFSWTS